MKHLAGKLAVVGAAAALVLGASAGSAMASFTLKGAGSTLLQPLVDNVWIPDFQAANSGDTVSYNPVGSGMGISFITANSVNFGASDAPMTAAQLTACGATCKQIPWALSATGPIYNLPGVSNLNLSGPVLAQIYLGTITMWNDPAIAALNKGVTLPNAPISVYWRNDGSGDTFVFESFLADTYPAYASYLGAAGPTTTSTFKVGTGVHGNSGVASAVNGQADSIGYASTFYVRDAGLPNVHGAAVENASGKFVRPYPEDMADAADLIPASALTSADYNTEPVIANFVASHGYHPKKLKKGQKPPKISKKQQAIDNEELAAYPLSTFTDVIVRSDGLDVPDLQTFIKFCLSAPEQTETKQGGQSFAPLPKDVVAFDLAQVNAL
jgi:phosphate transport system substrate-binding protein